MTQSTLFAHGPAAAEIADLSWVLFIAGTAIFIVVLVVVGVAVRGRAPAREWLARERIVVGAGIVFPVVALSLLLGYVYVIGNRLHAEGVPALRIEITGEQWWWRVRYLGSNGRPEFETANEIRIPAGSAVELTLNAADVIHSFWVPSLAGKIDMIPGRSNRLVVTATAAGTYRGQCAEFCGGPHALMALYVIAEGTAEFEAWRERQRRPAAGGLAFFDLRCGACHAVRGTAAGGTRGPDLTHVASRLHIAAGTLANTPANMSAWLADSQHAKPGNLMPAMRLTDAELQSVAAYMATLQ